VALTAVAADRLLTGPIPARARTATIGASAAAIALCATIALPGVLDPNDLDGRTANVPAALGVLLALIVSLAAVRARGTGARVPLTRGDRLALAAVPVVVVAAVPWILAGVGVYTGDVPVLEDVYVSKTVVSTPGEPQVRAVHLGNHEGIDGILLAATAFALRRALRRMRPTALRPLL